MPQLVQDEAGNLFVDTGGGVYHPVTPEQAQAFQGNQGMAENALSSVAQGTENLMTGAASLLSDNPYWLEQNQQGRAQSEAMNLAQPVTGPAAQFAPQAGVGLATGTAGIGATAGIEALLGAATTPETPIQGAAIGGALGAAGAALPGAVQSLYGRGRNAVDNLGWFNRGSRLEESRIPGYARPEDAMPVGLEQAGVQGAAPTPPPVDAPSSPYTNLADDMSAQASARPLQAPASDAVGDLPFSPSVNPPNAAPVPAPRMAERVSASINAADTNAPARVRVMGGNLSPEGLESMGIPVSEGQRRLLNAATGREAAEARDLLAREEAQMSSPVTGARMRQIRDSQQAAATNFLNRELDLPPDVGLTDPTLGDVFQRIGGRMDEIADEMGGVGMGDEIKTEFNSLMEQVTGGHRGQLQQLVDEIGAKADLNAGVLTGQQWGEVRTKVNNMIEAGMRQGNIGKVSDAGELMDIMTRAMEDGLPDASKQELRRLRKQYAIASTLSKAGARNADGQVNPVSFYNNWKRPQSKKLMGQDDVGSFMNTMVTLTKKRVPDSGTAGRLLQNAASMGLDFVPGGSVIKGVLR